jgi:hypothetical protein
MRIAYIILVGKSEGRRPFGRRRRRLKDNIKTDLRETEWEVVDWIHLVPDRYQWPALEVNLQVAKKAGNFLTS